MATQAYVNGKLVDLTEEEAQQVRSTQETPEASLERARVANINREVSARIEQVAPLYRQQNLSAHRIDVLIKRANNEAVSAADQALFEEGNEVSRKILALRDAGNSAVATGAAVETIVWPS